MPVNFFFILSPVQEQQQYEKNTTKINNVIMNVSVVNYNLSVLFFSVTAMLKLIPFNASFVLGTEPLVLEVLIIKISDMSFVSNQSISSSLSSFSTVYNKQYKITCCIWVQLLNL